MPSSMASASAGEGKREGIEEERRERERMGGMRMGVEGMGGMRMGVEGWVEGDRGGRAEEERQARARRLSLFDLHHPEQSIPCCAAWRSWA